MILAVTDICMYVNKELEFHDKFAPASKMIFIDLN